LKERQVTDYEHIFFESGGLGVEESARTLARILGMDYLRNDHGHLVATEWTDDRGRHVVGGDVDSNIFVTGPEDGPGEFSIMDDYPLVWSLTQRPAADRDEPQRVALDLLRRIVASDLRWPMALVTGFDWLIATYDVDRGLRIFPPGTSPEEDGAHLWR
jgi:hypothetical protein